MDKNEFLKSYKKKLDVLTNAIGYIEKEDNNLYIYLMNEIDHLNNYISNINEEYLNDNLIKGLLNYYDSLVDMSNYKMNDKDNRVKNYIDEEMKR
jgi:hypothetical protein